MTDDAGSTSYDEVPYPSLSYSQSHPDRLATVAAILGVKPPPIEHCRVLELGCASGGNIIPMALGLPKSEFVGIDLAARQIAQGRAMVDALQLRNISLVQSNILELDAGWGQFDYIIAHGVFSWVSRPVQEKLLEVCSQNLAPGGIAYVSYNTFPGWYYAGMMREMMMYHTRSINEPQERVARARGLLDFLAEAVPAEESVHGYLINQYSKFLRGEVDGSRPPDDALFLHDELEEVNEAIYFFQFAERAAHHGLQYLGEAEFRTMLTSNFPDHVSRALDEMANDVIELEQYMDFIRNRALRQTLLCHKDVPINRQITLKSIPSLYIASRARSIELEQDLHATKVAEFQVSDGATLATDHPVTKEAMLYLAQAWPRPVPFGELLARSRSRLGLDGAGVARDGQVLAANLMTAYGFSGNLVELHVHAPQMALEVSERPVASPLARLQAKAGARITNLRHERVKLDEFERCLLPYLDGHHDLDDLVDVSEETPAAEGVLALEENDGSIGGQSRVRRLLAQEVRKRLEWLARAALLTG
jgi:methyltransferase-like protein/2-polyprenyl-3-methyl-5-hydroxy-6-metoxy-1,4-benzoquinol methylase